MKDHDGSVALITGGSSGIGRAVAELLAAGGARVAVNSADVAEAGAVAAAITASGGQAVPAVADVRHPGYAILVKFDEPCNYSLSACHINPQPDPR